MYVCVRLCATVALRLQDMPSNFSDFKSRMTSARVRPTTEQPAQLKGLPLEG